MSLRIVYLLYFLLSIALPVLSVYGVCPIVTVPLASSVSLCSGGSAGFSSLEGSIVIDNAANPSFSGFGWYSDAGLTLPLLSDSFDFVGLNTCNVEVRTVYVGLLCSEQVAPIAAGELIVSIYPEPPSPLQTSDCQLIVSDVLCGGSLVIEYLQPDDNWAGTPSIALPFDGATAVWRAYILGSPDLNGDGFPDCFRTGTVVASDCPCIAPSAPVAVGGTLLSTCANTPNNDAFVVSSGVGTSVNWYDAGGVLVGTGNSFVAGLPGTYSAVAFSGDVSCVSSGTFFELVSEPVSNASFSYPVASVCVGDASFLPSFVAESGGVFTVLGGLSVDAFSGAVTPNMAGTFVVSHSLGGNCPSVDLELVTIDACCPIVTVPLSDSYVMCDGLTAPNFGLYESEVVYSDAGGNFLGLAWFSDIGLTLPLTPVAYSHTGVNSCLAETKTVYLGLVCATQNEPIAAGSLTIVVVPTPDSAVLSSVGGCSLGVTENCVGTLSIEYEQFDGSWSSSLPDLSPSEGQSANWRAFVGTAPDGNGDGSPDCFVSGTTTAESCNCTPPPTPVVLVDTITACAGVPNFQAFSVQVPSYAFVIWRDEAGNQVGVGNLYIPSVAGTYYAQSASIVDTCLGGQVAAYFIQSAVADASFSYSDNVFCSDGSVITPSVTGDLGGWFSASGGLSIDAVTGAIELSEVGLYNITYHAGVACPSVASVSLQLNSSTLSLSAGIDVGVCAGDTVVLNGSAVGALWSSWSGDGSFVSSGNDTTAYIPSVSGSFDLVLTAESACGVLQQDTVEVIAQPLGNFSVIPTDTAIVAGSGILLQTVGANNVIWEDDVSLTCTHCTQTVAFPTETTTYAVYSLEQCMLPQVVTVTVIEPVPIIPPDTLLVPNAFSPNQDGLNDEFIASISGEVVSYHLQVFNRWGNLLFDTTIPQFGWDGDFQGKASDVGSYVYQIDYQLVGQSAHFLRGSVVLLR